MCIVIIYRRFDAFSLFSYSSTLSSSSWFSLKKLFIVVQKIQVCLTCNIILNKSVITEVNRYPCISVLVVMMHTWDTAWYRFPDSIVDRPVSCGSSARTTYDKNLWPLAVFFFKTNFYCCEELLSWAFNVVRISLYVLRYKDWK